MLVSLKEAHVKFVEEHPENKIGLSKFCEMRPTNVKVFDHIPHHVCSSYHENVLPVEFLEFISQVTCNGSDALHYLQWQNTNSRVEKVEIIGTLEEDTAEAFFTAHM